MRLKDYGRNRKKRKEYIHQSGLLITIVDVSKAKYDVIIGTLEVVRSSGSGSPIMSTYKPMNVPTLVPALILLKRLDNQ